MLQYSKYKTKKLKKLNLTFFPGFTTTFNIKSNIIQELKHNKTITSYYYIELIEKQKFKSLYNLKETLIKSYLILAKKNKCSLNYLVNLRIDSLLYNVGLCITISQARNLIIYGHILVNLKLIKSPTYLVKKNDVISINPTSKNIIYLCRLNLLKRYYNVQTLSFNYLICVKSLKIKLITYSYINSTFIRFKDYLIFNFYK